MIQLRTPDNPILFQTYDAAYLRQISERIQQQEDPEWYIQIAAQAIDEMKSVEKGLEITERIIARSPKSPWREKFDFKEMEKLPEFSALPDFEILTFGDCRVGQNPERDNCTKKEKEEGTSESGEKDTGRDFAKKWEGKSTGKIHSWVKARIADISREKQGENRPEVVEKLTKQVDEGNGELKRRKEEGLGTKTLPDMDAPPLTTYNWKGEIQGGEQDSAFWGDNGELSGMPSPEETLDALKGRLEKDKIASLVNAFNASFDKPLSDEDLEWEGNKTSSRQNLESSGLAGNQDADLWSRLNRVMGDYRREKMPNYSESTKPDGKDGSEPKGWEKGYGPESVEQTDESVEEKTEEVVEEKKGGKKGDFVKRVVKGAKKLQKKVDKGAKKLQKKMESVKAGKMGSLPSQKVSAPDSPETGKTPPTGSSTGTVAGGVASPRVEAEITSFLDMFNSGLRGKRLSRENRERSIASGKVAGGGSGPGR